MKVKQVIINQWKWAQEDMMIMNQSSITAYNHRKGTTKFGMKNPQTKMNYSSFKVDYEVQAWNNKTTRYRNDSILENFIPKTFW